MKRTLQTLITVLLLGSTLLFSSCKKDESPKKDYADTKKGWVTGTWKQKDILLGVSTKVKLPNGTSLPLVEGSSMLDDPTINALLKALFGGNPFVLTRANTYSFNTDDTYKMEGNVDLILPVAGKSGKWGSEVYGSVIALFPKAETRDPHWINSITASKMNLSLTVNFPGLGDVPLKLILEK